MGHGSRAKKRRKESALFWCNGPCSATLALSIKRMLRRTTRNQGVWGTATATSKSLGPDSPETLKHSELPGNLPGKRYGSVSLRCRFPEALQGQHQLNQVFVSRFFTWSWQFLPLRKPLLHPGGWSFKAWHVQAGQQWMRSNLSSVKDDKSHDHMGRIQGSLGILWDTAEPW